MSGKTTVIANFVLVGVTLSSFTDERTGGQEYRSVKIGNQIWMAENLNFQTDYSWCYENNSSNCTEYGRLYTWDAAVSACPSGWRLPDTLDWRDLISYVGGSSIAGIKLKSKAWGGTDDYGFSALPGGYRGSNFYGLHLNGTWWTVTEGTTNNAAHRLGISTDGVYGDWGHDAKSSGYSVRCIQDQD
jgi:uncharacterized protein (TIGR02145 family)